MACGADPRGSGKRRWPGLYLMQAEVTDLVCMLKAPGVLVALYVPMPMPQEPHWEPV